MKHGKEFRFRNILLVCGIISTLLYIVMNIIGPIQFKGYSIFSQTVSELSAIGAPSRPLWAAQGIGYNILMIAFGLGIRLSAGGKLNLRIIGCLMAVYGVIGLPWMLFAPMHLRGGIFSLTDTMHIVFAMATVLLMLTAMGLGAGAFGRKFRIYSIGTIILLLVCGALTGVDAPRIAANLPTPLVGVWERINILGFLLWVIVLAIALIRQNSGGSRSFRRMI
jgi:hypothetical protein